MARQMAARALLAACSRCCARSASSLEQTLVPAFKLLSSGGNASSALRSFYTSPAVAEELDVSKQAVKLYEPARKYRSLADKELWHEAWMYEDRFGTEDDPIVVPSLEGERIIGVTDPEDDNLVVWGILRGNEPPRQFIEGGEFYVLKKVPYVAKVGDVVDEYVEAGAKPTLAK